MANKFHQKKGTVMPSVEEYAKCPNCGSSLGTKIIALRIQKQVVECSKCHKLIIPDMRVF
jgi:uncharacterized Zn finger protein